MPKSPKISVLMAVHNGQRYLQDAIDSILQQTETDFEFLIINDGSTDQTSKILNSCSKNDTRIRIFDQESNGLTKSLNTALKHSRGEFLARMDADDLSEPRRFEFQLEHLKKDKNCVAVGSTLLLIDPDGDPLCFQKPPITNSEIRKKLFEGHGSIPHPSAMIRRSALLEVGGYDESYRYAQDLDLWLRLSEIGELANLSQQLLRYRLHYQSITTGKRAEQLQCAQRAVQTARQRAQMPDGQPVSLPVSESVDRQDTEKQWMEMAIGASHFETASKYAWRQLSRSPFSITRWKKILRLRRQAKAHFNRSKNLDVA